MKRAALLAAVALTIAACGGSDEAGDGMPDPLPGPDGETTTSAPRPEVPEGAAGPGDRVSVDYIGTLDDGTEFDSSVGREPLSFVIDDGSMIAGFNEAVIGMAVGESKTVRIPAEDAYGPSTDDLVVEVPLDRLPEGVAAGDQLRSPTGQVVIVVKVTDEVTLVDTNHPLAGEALTFVITLVSIG